MRRNAADTGQPTITQSSQPAALPAHWLWLIVATSLLLGYTVISHLTKGIGDEDVHAYQIFWFINGRFEIFEHVTMPPVYHGIIAAMVKLAGVETFGALRAMQVVLASFAIPVFYVLARRLYPVEAATRTLQFFYLPILFPLFFLIYTDILSLVFVFGMIERTLKGKYRIAGLLALGAVSVRQPNLIWVAYAGTLALLQIGGGKISVGWLKHCLSQLWPFLVVFVLFGLFVLINGGVAIGDAAQHPVSFNISNLYFFLLVAFFLLLPFNLAQSKHIVAELMLRKWLLAVIAVTFIIYLFTYEHSHKYNATHLSYYRHNLLLHYTSDILPIKALTFLPIIWMALSFWVAAKNSNFKWQLYFLYFFGALSFIPMPLIEQRYYFVALCLFIAFRPSQSLKADMAMLYFYIGFVTYLLFNISRANFFL